MKTLEQIWLEISLDPVLFIFVVHVSLSIICLCVLTCGIRATSMLFCLALKFVESIIFVNISCCSHMVEKHMGIILNMLFVLSETKFA
jgi:hypothetical protein